MATRVFIQDGRVLLSKPGFNADSPNLDELNKSFDSNWLFQSRIIQQGWLTSSDTGDPKDLGATLDWQSSFTKYSFDVSFPEQTFIPAVSVFQTPTVGISTVDVLPSNLGRKIGQTIIKSGNMSMPEIKVRSNKFTMTRRRRVDGAGNVTFETVKNNRFYYVVWGF